jgi:N-acetylglucosaminyl-diphospho-decaprenol L-rhamnosyltransferase
VTQVATPQVSCVIPCYHRAELLRRAVVKLDDPRIEIVIVNSEADPEVAVVAEPYVHIPRESSGFASGVNLAMSRVSADYVVFMNDDVLIEPEAVLELRDTIESGRADVAVPAIVDASGAPEISIRALPTPWALVREWLLLPERPVAWLRGRVHVEKWRSPAQPEPIEAAGTPVIATSSELLRAVPISEDYFLNWCEVEWFWRVGQLGKRVLFLPQVKAVHLGGGQQELSPFRSQLMTTNAVRCVRRTQGRSAARLAFLIVCLYNLRLVAAAVLRRLLGREGSRGELEARLAGLQATGASWREAK